MDQFQLLTNISINLAGVICLFLGLALPDQEIDYVNDSNWRLTYGFPLIWTTIQLFIMTTIFKYEPIGFLISQGKSEEVIKFLALLYKTPKAHSESEKREVFERFIALEKSKVLAGQN